MTTSPSTPIGAAPSKPERHLLIRREAGGSGPRVSRAQAEQMLGLGRTGVTNLQAAHVLDDLRLQDVAALASRGWVSSSTPLAIVRCGKPTIDDDGRHIGWSQLYNPHVLLQASRQWWVSDPDAVHELGHLLVTSSTFVVAVLAVTGVEKPNVHITPGGATVRRYSYQAQLLGNVTDLVAGAVHHDAAALGLHPERMPLLATLGQRVPSPPGAPLILQEPAMPLPPVG